MGGKTRILLFGDQTNSFDASLRHLLHIKENAALTAFFERTHYALRLEISQLPLFKRKSFPRFTSLLDLLSRYQEADTNPALESALACSHQLACFISNYGGGSETYPLPSECLIVGLCTGLLAGAAVSSCRTVAELLPVAVESVLIAFRTGLRVMEACNVVEGTATPSAHWSVVVPGIQEEAAIDVITEFCSAQALSPHSKPYVSATNPKGLTISGPPAILEELFRSPLMKDFKAIKVPIYGPYHATHLFDQLDVDGILQGCSESAWSSSAPSIPILSSATGRLLDSPDYISLLHAVLREILLEPLRWKNVLEGCMVAVTSSKASQCTILPIATGSAQSLGSALRQVSGLSVAIDDSIACAGTKFRISTPTGRPEQSKIAIIGRSGRFPDAASDELFWDLLYRGLDVHREVPKDRFDVKTHFDPTGKKNNSSRVPYGCWIENPGLFDARFFNMSPREAAQADPGQRLAIVTAYEALEMAGFVPDRTPSSQRDRVGVFYGMTSDDWREVNSGQKVDTYFIPGGNRAFTPGRINYHFKFSGPSFSVDTACSSSLAAINLACDSLWRGDCDTALAGGTNVLTNPDNFAGLDRAHFLSKTGNCNTFDDGADGYCRADGVGTVVLKRLEDAQADNDPIQGVIVGAYTNHSAEAVSMTRPHVGAQAFIFDKILNAANLDPLDVSYIEMHGTGTQAGDGVEMKSVLDVFAPAHRTRSPAQSLHLGSAKANIGHGESASGVTSLIKVLLMMEKNLIPPHCGIKTKINHTFPTDLAERNIHIAFKPTAWIRAEGEQRQVFVNNFSAAGGNTALLLEDAPMTRKRRQQDSRSNHVVAISARSIPSLKNNIQTLISFINGHSDLALSDLSYTTTARRIHHNFRLLLCGSDLRKIQEDLEAAGARTDFASVPTVSPKVAFVFTGQGSQYVGMGHQLFASFSQFRSDVQRFDKIAQRQGFPAIQPMIDGTTSESDSSPTAVQLSLVCLQMATARLWISWGVRPAVVVGHSLGEFAALHVAGVLSASDAIYLAGRRARLLEEHCSIGTHAMLAVKGSVSSLDAYWDAAKFEVACINGPEDTVISGIELDVDRLSDSLVAHGFKCTKLKVPFAFHSGQVQPILETFEAEARGVAFHKPGVPVISPLLKRIITDTGSFGPKYLSRHCRETVDFLGGIQMAKDDGLIGDSTVWVEIGAHPVCSGMIKSILGPKTTTLASMRRNEDTWKVLTQGLAVLHLAGVDVQWDEYHRDVDSLQVLPLPSYSWDNANHWIQYEHDWCLTKGSPPPPAKLEPRSSSLSTTTVQQVIEEHAGKDGGTITIESNLAEPNLKAVLQGHKVNGAALCPSSVYADVALTLASHLLERYRPEDKKLAMDVSNMIVEKPLIGEEGKEKRFRACATLTWSTKATEVCIYSVDAQGKKTIDHAKCSVKYADGDAWLQDWARNAYLIHSRVERLQKGVDENGGQSHKMKRGMAYKLFGALVEYNQSFRGMEEVVLDSANHEATARVIFQAPPASFYFSPYWIDSLGHISGFVMNANDAVDSKTQVYVNHGWDSMRCAKKFSPDQTYQTYVRMQPTTGTIFAGDVYIMEEETIVAIYHGVKFQGIPRKYLDALLPPASATKSASKSTTKSIPETGGRHNIPRSTPSPTTQAVPTNRESRSPVLSSTVLQALAIVAEEIGVPVSDLSDSTSFADLGVDSLLSLNIAGKFRELLDMDIESSFFSECPTVKELKRFFVQSGRGGDGTPESFPSSSELDASDTATPLTTDSHSSFSGKASSTTEDEAVGTMGLIRQILAEEIGVAARDIKDDTSLGELGVDSLLALTVLGRLRETVDIDLPSDIFAGEATLGSVSVTLGLDRQAVESVKPVQGHSSAPGEMVHQAMPPASSILLQGNSKTATKSLFLFPDGSGSATSYATLPRVDPDVAVYGLNCPYMTNPEDLRCGLAELTAPYITEIRRRQPHGPYYFGGWSAGGISAYDAAQQLIKQGEVVARLILLDSPFPIGLSKLPPRLYAFFETVGLFGTGAKAPPKWLLPHFLAFIDALDAYTAVPFAPGTAPPTYLIWAEDGVCKDPADPRPEPRNDDPKEMTWLLENRSDFGPNGWDSLLPGQALRIERMAGANHFSMMKDSSAKILSAFIGRAMR